jgi:hypothetical protein
VSERPKASPRLHRRAWCQQSCVPKDRTGRLTFEELAAVSLTGLEFDRDDVTERLVQELDGNTLSSCRLPDEVGERAVSGDERARARRTIVRRWMLSSAVTRLVHGATLCTQWLRQDRPLEKWSERTRRTHEVGHSGGRGAVRVAEMNLDRNGQLDLYSASDEPCRQ